MIRLPRKPLRKLSWLVAFFVLFQKTPEPKPPAEILLQDKDDDPTFSRIRCPLCKWQPRASDLWQCNDCGHPEYFFTGCGTCWNTFETHGQCPGCGHQWQWTACLYCDGWSLHEDWYTNESD